jgi:hypothetical protein
MRRCSPRCLIGRPADRRSVLLYSILRTALVSVGLLLLLITFTPLVPWAAAQLCVDWSDRDGEVLIVLLGTTVGDDGDAFIGANSYWRTAYAVRSWHYGRFRKILLCGKGVAETIKAVLIAYGVSRRRDSSGEPLHEHTRKHPQRQTLVGWIPRTVRPSH